MDETDIMDLTHHRTRKRARPISSLDCSAESVQQQQQQQQQHAASRLKRPPIRAASDCCRDPSLLMFASPRGGGGGGGGDPTPAAALKQNDHSVSSSPNTVMPAQVKKIKIKEQKRKLRKRSDVASTKVGDDEGASIAAVDHPSTCILSGSVGFLL